MPEEEKRRQIDEFISKYNSTLDEFFSEEKKVLFDQWVELYQATVPDRIKNRVKRIV